MSDIGSNHFLDQLEKLPDEEVVWEGGSSYRGVGIQFIHAIGALILIAAVFAVTYGLPKLLFTDNPNYVAQPTNTPANTDHKDANKDVASVKPKAPKEPREIFNTVLFKKLLILGVPVLLILILGAMWIRIKNYWFVVTTERICIQSGVLTRQTVAIDIDKIVSVISTHSLLDRLFSVHSIEIVHSGLHPLRAQQGLVLFNPYKMPYVLTRAGLASQLLNNWLPRDNHK